MIAINVNKEIHNGFDTGLAFLIDNNLYYSLDDRRWSSNNNEWNEFVDALFTGRQIGVFFKGNIIAAFSPSKDNISKFKSMAKYCHKRK